MLISSRELIMGNIMTLQGRMDNLEGEGTGGGGVTSQDRAGIQRSDNCQLPRWPNGSSVKCSMTKAYAMLIILSSSF